MQSKLSDNAIKTHCKMLVWYYNDAFLKAPFPECVSGRTFFCNINYCEGRRQKRQKASFSSLPFLFLSFTVRTIISALKQKAAKSCKLT